MALDDADKKFITDLIAGSLKTNNEALGQQFVTAEAAGKMVEQGLAAGLGKLDLAGQIKNAVGEATKGLKPPEGDGKGGKGKEGEGSKDPEFLKLQEQLAEVQKQNRTAEEARQAAEARERENRLDAAARDALAKAGIPADRHAMVLPYLRTLKTDDGKPVLTVDEAGNARFSVQKKGYVDALSVEEGIAGWAKSDAAKVYLPASGRQGTGESGGSGNAGNNGSSGNAPRTSDGTVDWTKLGQKASLGSALSQTS